MEKGKVWEKFGKSPCQERGFKAGLEWESGSASMAKLGVPGRAKGAGMTQKPQGFRSKVPGT